MSGNLLIVDDHSLIVEGIKNVVSNMKEFEDIYTASCGNEAKKLLKLHYFDLCIIDLELPDMDGFELIRIIAAEDKNARILVNTMHDEIWTVKRLYENNINGAIVKTSDICELKHAIIEIMNDKTYYCSHFKRILSLIHESKTEVSEYTLTLREEQVLRCIAKGMNTKEIAEELCLSTNTIESHRKNLLVKLEAKNSIDLIMKAIHNGKYELLRD